MRSGDGCKGSGIRGAQHRRRRLALDAGFLEAIGPQSPKAVFSENGSAPRGGV